MKRRLVAPALIAGAILLTAAVVYAATSAPGFFPSDECEMRIVDMKFLPKVEASDGSMTENTPEKYHFTVVTFRIDKPENRDLTLPAADITLHYRRGGDDYDVSPCEALSSFTTARDEDRTLNMPAVQGPGWVKVKTGAGARKAGVIYADAVFSKIEPDARKFWLSIGQPATTQFDSEGWEP
jgi:hypothetical protein